MYLLLCIVFFSFESTPDYTRLVVAHNREMYFSRPTTTATWWKDSVDTPALQILAPRDNVRGGTWIGYENSTQRVAFLTNLKHHVPFVNASRGDLIREFLESKQSASKFLDDLHSSGAVYAGYRLVVFCGQELGFYSNSNDDSPVLLPPGIHGFSNNQIGEIWARVEHGKALFAQVVQKWKHASPKQLKKAIFRVMRNTKKHARRNTFVTEAHDVLYQTSSVFVRPFIRDNEPMATRTTTVIAIGSNTEGVYAERNLDVQSLRWQSQVFNLPPLKREKASS